MPYSRIAVTITRPSHSLGREERKLTSLVDHPAEFKVEAVTSNYNAEAEI